MKRLSIFTVIMTIIIINSSLVFAHSGRTDANGGHYNRSTGEYHYHNGGGSNSSSTSSSSTVISKATVQKQETTTSHKAMLHKNPIVINSTIFNKDLGISEEYPIFLCNDIIYIPLSWNINNSLGISSSFENQTLTLNTLNYYNDSVELVKNYDTKKSNVYLQKPSFNIVINGEIINNDKEEYPFLVYNDITYLPLTWNNIVNRLSLSYSVENQNITINNLNK